jgi:phage shock protein A
MTLLRFLVLKLGLWVGIPLLLLILIVGPKRFWYYARQGWNWLFARRLEPEAILAQIVDQQHEHIRSVKHALAQAEAAEADVLRNLEASRATVSALQAEARALVDAGDELGAKGALYKMNLERAAITSFEDQLGQQRALIDESRKRLYTIELQLRQFEVGRSILLSQLAQAKSLEQQYEIASQFDPFHAVENWEKAEGMVHEKALTAQVKHRVLHETNDLNVAQTVDVDPAMLEAQLNELRQVARSGTAPALAEDPPRRKLSESNAPPSEHPSRS